MVKLPGKDKGSPSDALRAAIERTFEATADSAAGTRDRASELLDEVTDRARDVRDEIGKAESSVRRKLKG